MASNERDADPNPWEPPSIAAVANQLLASVPPDIHLTACIAGAHFEGTVLNRLMTNNSEGVFKRLYDGLPRPSMRAYPFFSTALEGHRTECFDFEDILSID